MQQRGEVPEHALKAHVGRHGRGLHFAAHVEVAVAKPHLRHGDRCVHAFADENHIRPTGRISAGCARKRSSPEGTSDTLQARKTPTPRKASTIPNRHDHAGSTGRDAGGGFVPATARIAEQASRERPKRRSRISALGLLRAEAGDEKQAARDRADYRADRIGRIDAPDQSARRRC